MKKDFTEDNFYYNSDHKHDNNKNLDVEVLISEGLFDLFNELKTDTKTESYEDNVKCPVCGKSVKEIKRDFTVGCAVCYSIFKEEISSILSFRFLMPDILSEREMEIKKLEDKLSIAVHLEKYEEADEIKKILEDLKDDNIKL